MNNNHISWNNVKKQQHMLSPNYPSYLFLSLHYKLLPNLDTTYQAPT